MTIDISIHQDSYSATINGKYIESNNLDNIMLQMSEEEEARFRKFEEEHLEAEDYSDYDRPDSDEDND